MLPTVDAHHAVEVCWMCVSERAAKSSRDAVDPADASARKRLNLA